MLALSLGGVVAVAHEGPEHEIEELTERIESTGATPDLLVDRALEYGLIGKHADALNDLERAVSLDPTHLAALRELARQQVATRESEKALETLGRALRLRIMAPVDRGGLHIQRAEVLLAAHRYREALEDCDAALHCHRENPEWYLLRSDLQALLGLHRRRIAGLAEGLERTGAGVLETERLDALLDAGKFREALPGIEAGLATSRVTCRWLVRRGRAFAGMGRKEEGAADLHAALAELATLLRAARPDPTWYRDQAAAQLALGDRDAARRTLDTVRAIQGHSDVAARIEVMIGARTPG
ncbi:MAG: tetratricopeptide repeat protein, partial [Verrucomicrobiales bacterium]|nr:tetratricopeptide repeat protein [Verrucomicrobiales bacterium]